MLTFFSNGENKERTVDGKKNKGLELLEDQPAIISKQNLCKSITLSAVLIVESLLSNQVEADKRVTLH